MEYSIIIARCGGVAPATTSILRIGEGGCTIGRNPDNDLPLNDPDRVISGHHARLDYRDGALWVTDLSTNGTFLNQATERLPLRQLVRLTDGDTLTVGPYELVITASERATGSDYPGPLDLMGNEGLPGLPGPEAAPDILDILGAGPSSTAPLTSPGTGPGVQHSFADAMALDSLLSGPATPAEPALAIPPPTPFEHVHFRPPEIEPAVGLTTGQAAPGAHLTPDDYDLLADAFGTGSLDHAQTFGAPGPITNPVETTPPAPSESEVQAVPPVSAAPVATQSAPIPVSGESAMAVPSVTPPTEPGPAQGMPDSGLGAFLAGLGTGSAEMVKDPNQLLEDAGRLLRELAQGLTTTMQARAEFKSELRLGVTTIRAAENNPFKFSVGVDETLERLLFRSGPGFMHAVEAARGAFEDIQAHEMAMIAGLRAALRALLARFEPAELEHRLGAASGLDKLLPMARRSRYWELFTDTYDQVAADASEDFMQLFGDAFTRAYEDQIHRLALARRQPHGAPV